MIRAFVATKLINGALAKMQMRSATGLSQARTTMGSRMRAPQTIVRAASTISESGAPRVAIIGGGFGGLYTAVRLDELMWRKGKKPEITLIDQGDRFVFKPLLYELLNGTAVEAEVAPTFTEMLASTSVQYVQAKVVGIEEVKAGDSSAPPSGNIALEGGASIGYDYLVMAMGAQSDPRGVPGVADLAVPFISYEDAMKVKGVMEELSGRDDGRFVIVGAGYSGVELASVVAERMGGKAQVTLVTPGASILGNATSGQQAASQKVLDALGVNVMTGTKVTKLRAPDADDADATSSTACYVEVQAPGSCYIDGSLSAPVDSVLPADIVVWTAGLRPATSGTPNKTQMLFPGLATSADGRIETSETLVVSGTSHVFALGDVSRPGSREVEGGLPATAQVAFQEADYAAWNVWASINGRPLLPFRYQHLGSMMTLGALGGAVALPATLPESIAKSINSSPLGPLLNAAGIRVSTPTDAEMEKEASATGVSGVTLEGPLAAVLRRAAYLYRQPTNERRLDVAVSWVKGATDVLSSLAGSRSRS